MKFEEDVRWVCGENWETAPQEERDGALGVLLFRAYMDGARPSFDELIKAVGVPTEQVREFEVAYRRLQVSGVFTMRYAARRDRALQGWSSRADGRVAWCHIAGIASGWIGNGYFIQREKPILVNRIEAS